MENNESIINWRKEEGTPQEQLINKLKKENQRLKSDVNNLKAKINELKKQNEDLTKQNININIIINEEPNEDSIKKEVELRSQLRTLQLTNQLTETSYLQEKSINEGLNKKIGELELELKQNNFKNSETIKALEKKIVELENKLYNPTNSGVFSNESLQYYLSLFNDNINQFISLVNRQNKINNDLSENHLFKIENFMNEKEKIFSKKVNDILLKISQNSILKNSGDLSKNGNLLFEKDYRARNIWFEKQIEELMPYKQQCLILNEQVSKLSGEVNIYKNKIEISKKINKEKEEVYNLKMQKVKGIKDTFDKFIKQNCPNKYDEYKLICQNFSFDG